MLVDVGKPFGVHLGTVFFTTSRVSSFDVCFGSLKVTKRVTKGAKRGAFWEYFVKLFGEWPKVDV